MRSEDYPTTADYVAADVRSHKDRIVELERKVELLGQIVSTLCDLNGTTFREEMEYQEELDKRNADFAKKHKAQK